MLDSEFTIQQITGFHLVNSPPADASAILVVGVPGCVLFEHVGNPLQLPVTIITRGWKNIAELVNERMLVRMAVPLFGRPLLWSRLDFYAWWRHASPRGRFDSLWLLLQRILIPLFIGRYAWMIAIDRDYSVIGGLLKQRGVVDRLWQHTRTRMLIIMGDEKVIKIPLDVAVGKKLATSYENLRTLTSRYRHTDAAAYFPRNFEVAEQARHRVFIEDRLSGVSAYQVAHRRSQKLQVYTSALGFLEQWYATDPVRVSVDTDTFIRYWLAPLDSIKTFVRTTPFGHLWESLENTLWKKLCGRSIPLVPLHGDFWLNNILVDTQSKRVKGVIDWDNAQTRGLPLTDFFHLISWRSSRFHADFASSLLRRHLYQRDKAIAPLLIQHCKNIGMTTDIAGDIYAHYWLVELAKRIEEVAVRRRILTAMRIILRYYQCR